MLKSKLLGTAAPGAVIAVSTAAGERAGADLRDFVSALDGLRRVQVRAATGAPTSNEG
jgi:hypothetical protein